MLLSSLISLCFPLFSAAAIPKFPRCLPSGDEKPINHALLKGMFAHRSSQIRPDIRDSSGDKSVTVSLCAGSVHRLKTPIVFTAHHQTLTTEGNSTGRDRALIIVEGSDQSIAIRSVPVSPLQEDLLIVFVEPTARPVRMPRYALLR